MIDTVIVSGGNINKDFALDFLKKMTAKAGRRNICLIAVDRGFEFFIGTDLKPDIAVGDFDSISERGRKLLELAEHMEVRRLKPEKDDTDTQSAVQFAASRGAKRVLIFGATGTRLDHVISNLSLLCLGKTMGLEISIMDANNYITLVESGTVLRRKTQFGKYVSFFPAGGDVKGLTLEGFKYPLDKHYLMATDCGLTVSNEIIEETARITFETGELMMVMSRD